MIEVITLILMVTGLIFFLCGSIGLLRLPDLYSRLHALTKADNLGLGLLLTGIALYQQDLLFALKLVLTWLAVLTASSVSAYLIAQYARRQETGR
jgi:multicomponent Na+:H+ antiporter subunit G